MCEKSRVHEGESMWVKHKWVHTLPVSYTDCVYKGGQAQHAVGSNYDMYKWSMTILYNIYIIYKKTIHHI